jgi:hypothetical protein
MRLTLLFLLFSGAASAPNPDFGVQMSMCQEIQTLPKNIRVIEGCDGRDKLKSCEFISNSNSVIYSIENKKVVQKSFNFIIDKDSKLGIYKYDSPIVLKKKLKKYGVFNLEQFSDDDIYLQSEYFKCIGNEYRLFINYEKKWVIKDITLSIFPAI